MNHLKTYKQTKGEHCMKKFLPILMILALVFTGCGTQNQAPVITSPSTASATVGTEFSFTVVATDADGDELTYEVAAPEGSGMVISEEGVISGWTPAEAGTVEVTITVSDGKNDPVTQTLTITATAATPSGPEIEISVDGEYPVAADGKTYIRGGKRDISVKFQNPYPEGDEPQIKVGSVVVPGFSADRKTWTGSHHFSGDGVAETITVGGVCAESVCASKSYVVDDVGPYAEIKASAEACECDEGYQLTLTSDWLEEGECAPEGEGCCDDDVSGLASWNIRVYDEDPWEECCDPDPCIEPICEDEGEECPVSITCDCIDEVFTSEGWLDFFDKNYWVILSLTDQVGNETTYYGWLETDGENDELVRFVELVVDPTNPDCWCFGEDVALADLTLGDCYGTPATECYAAPLDECPEVTVEPAEPMVGEEATITIDYTEAVAPDCPAAYVGPAIKTLPLGIPETAQELVLTDNGDDTYTATYTFGQEGTDYIYVTDACGDCSPCKTGVTVLAADVCPEVEFLDAPYMAEGVPYYGLEDMDFTVTFANEIEKELVDVYVGIPGLGPILMPIELPPTVVEVQMSTEDEMTYTGSVPFSKIAIVLEHAGYILDELWQESCIPMMVYVLAGDPCCVQTCEYPFVIDPVPPCVELIAEVEECGDECEPGHQVLITSDAFNPCECEGCVPLLCEDTCTEVAGWTLEVYDTEPFESDECGGCVPDPCVNPIAEDEGIGCPVELNVFGCIADSDWGDEFDDEGNHYVIFTVEDMVGNSVTSYGVLEVNSGSYTAYLVEVASIIDGGGCNPDCTIDWGKAHPQSHCGEEYNFINTCWWTEDCHACD
jgi:hypothetical protein